MARRKSTTATPAAKLTFRRPVWPERACRAMIAGPYAYHSCEVVEAHKGPHATYEVRQSLIDRAQWEADHPDEIDARTSEIETFIP